MSEDNKSASRSGSAGKAFSVFDGSESITLSANPLKGSFLDVSPALLLVLNADRRIVHANSALLDFIGVEGGEASIIGKLPGDAFRCVNSKKGPCGCGSSEFCGKCGAFIAFMDSVEHGRKSSGECHMARETDGHVESIDLRISCSPLRVESNLYIVLNAIDIGDELRRNYLEGVFINEIKNSAGNVSTLGGMLIDECAGSPAAETASMLLQAASRLMSEIESHRMLIDAETGSLKLEPVSFSSVQLLDRLAAEYAKGPFGEGKRIEVLPDSAELPVFGDPAVVSRAIGNLIRNALEATGHSQPVKLSCEAGLNWNQAVFKIWNEGDIDRDVQLQIFRRYFSTKSAAKGIGTYMSRLLVERYLNGSVSFESSKEEGTLFLVRLPIREPAEASAELAAP